ncbi:MAG: hypothetical protein H0X08_00265 [Blastocatellia bacterium]|nr:hypothetical protein [Blastocatellia bacterium]
MKTLFFVSIVSASILASACSSNTAPNVNTATVANKAASNSGAANGTVPAKADDVPAAVKAALPNAQTFTTQHKDLTDAQVASIEKDTGGKVSEKDHHSYLAFSSVDGARTQVGAATVINVAGKELVIVYDNKEGSPVIKEVKAVSLAPAFLSQFTGKGHDDDLLVGADIKPNGLTSDEAAAVTEAIRIDVLSMQALYGKAHAH